MPFSVPPVKLSILMPAYNEERTIAQAVYEILQVNLPCEFELIVVDDGSTDGTGIVLAQLNDPRLIVHRHVINRGKGAALLSAASLATGTHILPFDADLEYLAEDIPRVLEPVLKGRCDVVYGARLCGCNTLYQSFRYAAGNRLLTRIANILYDSYLSDLHTCLKLMPLSVMRSLRLSEEGFGLDTEVTALLLKSGIRPFEVPVSYYSRSRAQGKKINSRDAITCVWILLRIRLRGRNRLEPGREVPEIDKGYHVLIPQQDNQPDLDDLKVFRVANDEEWTERHEPGTATGNSPRHRRDLSVSSRRQRTSLLRVESTLGPSS